jgi:hypothetical protein
MEIPIDSSRVSKTKKRVSQDPEKRAKQLANLRPFRKGDERGRLAREKAKSRVITAALVAKMVRKRAASIAEALIKEAERGNVFAFNSLADRVEGKVVQQIEVSGNVDLGVRIAAARERRRLAAANDDAVVTAQECDGDHEESQAQENALVSLPLASPKPV